MPLILLAAKADQADRAGEETVSAGFLVAERDADRMGIFLVLVDQHHRPLAIGTEQGIGRHQNVTRRIRDIAFGGKDLMLARTRLCPFQVDQLAGEKLRRGLLDLVGAPVFVVWKLILMLNRHDARKWVRTERKQS